MTTYTSWFAILLISVITALVFLIFVIIFNKLEKERAEETCPHCGKKINQKGS